MLLRCCRKSEQNDVVTALSEIGTERCVTSLSEASRCCCFVVGRELQIGTEATLLLLRVQNGLLLHCRKRIDVVVTSLSEEN